MFRSMMIFIAAVAMSASAAAQTGTWQIDPAHSCLLYTSPSPRDS